MYAGYVISEEGGKIQQVQLKYFPKTEPGQGEAPDKVRWGGQGAREDNLVIRRRPISSRGPPKPRVAVADARVLLQPR